MERISSPGYHSSVEHPTIHPVSPRRLGTPPLAMGGGGLISCQGLSERLLTRSSIHGAYLSRAEGNDRGADARDRQGHRARGGQGRDADEQGSSAQGSVHGAGDRDA